MHTTTKRAIRTAGQLDAFDPGQLFSGTTGSHAGLATSRGCAPSDVSGDSTGRPPCPPLVLFKMSLLQHCYGLSDSQCEELVGDRLSWRRHVGLGLQDKVPDETTLVSFRARLVEHGLHEKLLALVNRQLEKQGLILKTCTLVDATLLQAARLANKIKAAVMGRPVTPSRAERRITATRRMWRWTKSTH
jgi:transposase